MPLPDYPNTHHSRRQFPRECYHHTPLSAFLCVCLTATSPFVERHPDTLVAQHPCPRRHYFSITCGLHFRIHCASALSFLFFERLPVGGLACPRAFTSSLAISDPAPPSLASLLLSVLLETSPSLSTRAAAAKYLPPQIWLLSPRKNACTFTNQRHIFSIAICDTSPR